MTHFSIRPGLRKRGDIRPLSQTPFSAWCLGTQTTSIFYPFMSIVNILWLFLLCLRFWTARMLWLWIRIRFGIWLCVRFYLCLVGLFSHRICDRLVPLSSSIMKCRKIFPLWEANSESKDTAGSVRCRLKKENLFCSRGYFTKRSEVFMVVRISGCDTMSATICEAARCFNPEDFNWNGSY
jgi:hypothetical protein